MSTVSRRGGGSIQIILTADEANTFVDQGFRDHAFKGNDLLWPICEEVEALVSEPRCDICDRTQITTPGMEWNGETGNHVWCESRLRP